MKKKILIFNKFYLPGFRAGGPVRTISNLVSHLGDEFDFYIVTLDRDVNSSCAYQGINKNEWNKVGGAHVMYLSTESVLALKIRKIIEDLSPNLIYLNSFFDQTFTFKVIWLRRFGFIPFTPVLLAPRGEFSPEAVKIKPIRKKLYLALSKALGLFCNIKWHASTQFEQEDIIRTLSKLGNEPVYIARDLPSTSSLIFRPQHGVRETNLPLKVCFLSRISPMKNLDFALRALKLVRSQVAFTIYGPIEVASHWAKCQQLIASLPSNVQAYYAGELHPSEVPSKLSQHDLFFLPTRGENYGHVIREALGAGLPVLLSDQTPWCEVTARGSGWTLPLASEALFSRKIDEVANLRPEHLTRMKECALKYAKWVENDSGVVDANRNLFLMVMERRSV